MNITKRGRRIYELVWELGPDPVTGKRRREAERFHGTLDEAKTRYLTRQQELNEGIGRDQRGLTVAELARDWLEHKRTQKRKPSTIERYAQMVTQYIIPTLGRMKLAELTAYDVQRAVHAWQRGSRKDGKPGTLSPRTVQYAYRTLATMLGQAVRWQLIGRNVALNIEPPTVRTKEARWWTAEEAAQFLQIAQTHMHGIVYVLALMTGLRKGELLGLRWQDIDWEQSTITVRQRQDSHAPRTFDQPKTDRGRRIIAMDAQTLDLLKAHRTVQKRRRLAAGPGWEDWDLVCCTGRGTPLSARNVSRDFDKLQVKAGVPRIPFHDLRHTHGSLLRAVGTDFRVIADRLGHSQVSFTIQVYTHASAADQIDPATQISRILLGPSSNL